MSEHRQLTEGGENIPDEVGTPEGSEVGGFNLLNGLVRAGGEGNSLERNRVPHSRMVARASLAIFLMIAIPALPWLLVYILPAVSGLRDKMEMAENGLESVRKGDAAFATSLMRLSWTSTNRVLNIVHGALVAFNFLALRFVIESIINSQWLTRSRKWIDLNGVSPIRVVLKRAWDDPVGSMLSSPLFSIKAWFALFRFAVYFPKAENTRDAREAEAELSYALGVDDPTDLKSWKAKTLAFFVALAVLALEVAATSAYQVGLIDVSQMSQANVAVDLKRLSFPKQLLPGTRAAQAVALPLGNGDRVWYIASLLNTELRPMVSRGANGNRKVDRLESEPNTIRTWGETGREDSALLIHTSAAGVQSKQLMFLNPVDTSREDVRVKFRLPARVLDIPGVVCHDESKDINVNEIPDGQSVISCASETAEAVFQAVLGSLLLSLEGQDMGAPRRLVFNPAPQVIASLSSTFMLIFVYLMLESRKPGESRAVNYLIDELLLEKMSLFCVPSKKQKKHQLRPVKRVYEPRLNGSFKLSSGDQGICKVKLINSREVTIELRDNKTDLEAISRLVNLGKVSRMNSMQSLEAAVITLFLSSRVHADRTILAEGRSHRSVKCDLQAPTTFSNALEHLRKFITHRQSMMNISRVTARVYGLSAHATYSGSAELRGQSDWASYVEARGGLERADSKIERSASVDNHWGRTRVKLMKQA